MTVRNLLVRAYPRSWREEYGEELAGVLARRRLTFAVAVDVLGGAARQHLYRDDPWKICGTGLFAWTVCGLLLKWYTGAVLVFPVFFVAGLWTVLRTKSGIFEGGLAAVPAASLCCAPDIIAVLLNGPVPVRHGGAIWYRWGLFVASSLHIDGWQYVELLSLVLVASAVLGLAGALTGKFLAGVRKGLHA
jgi:hypothetical protein